MALGSIRRAAPLFEALAEGNRLAIVERLRQGPRNVTDLCEDLGMAQPLMSFHLKALRDAGLVHARREGRTVWYALDSGGVQRLERAVAAIGGRAHGDEDATIAAELAICRQYINVG